MLEFAIVFFFMVVVFALVDAAAWAIQHVRLARQIRRRKALRPPPLIRPREGQVLSRTVHSTSVLKPANVLRPEGYVDGDCGEFEIVCVIENEGENDDT